MRQIFIAATFLLLTSCLPNKAGDSLDIADIDSILISQRHHDDKIADSTKKLDPAAIKLFADSWNNSFATDITKFLPQYVLTVYFKDKTSKKFRTSGSSVKEKNDYTIVFADTSFFDKMWYGGHASR